jgi:Na+/melibiose symporter-like transporter
MPSGEEVDEAKEDSKDKEKFVDEQSLNFDKKGFVMYVFILFFFVVFLSFRLSTLPFFFQSGCVEALEGTRQGKVSRQNTCLGECLCWSN